MYQQGDVNILPFADKMAAPLVLPGSGIAGMEHLVDLYEKAVSGKSCLLFLEQYSNMDLPLFSYLLRNDS